MRPLKKTLKWTALLAGGLLAAALAFVLVFLAKPGWFLNTRTVSWGLARFGAAYQPRWSELSFDARSKSFLEKSFSLKTRDFCFRDRIGSVAGCFKNIDVALDLRGSRQGVSVTEVSRFLVAGDYLRLDAARRTSPEAAKRAGGAFSLPGLLPRPLRTMRLRSLDVDLPRNEVIQASGTVMAGFKLLLTPSRPRPLTLSADMVRTSSGLPAQVYRADAQIASDVFDQGRLTYIDAQGRLKGGAGLNADVSARVEERGGGETALTLRTRARQGGLRLDLGLAGAQTAERFGSTLTLEVRQSSGQVKALRLAPCRLEAQPVRLALDCRLELEPTALRGQVIAGTLSAEARPTPRFGAPDHFDGSLQLKLRPLKDWYELRAGLKAKVSGRRGRLPESLKVSQDLDAALKVPDFQRLVSFLTATPYAVPAPFHVLKGPLSFELTGKGDPREDQQVFEYRLASDLSGARQRLKAEVGGRVTARRLFFPDRSLAARTEVLLSDVALQLPRIDVKGLPPLRVDRRIVTPARRAALARKAQAKVRTSTGTLTMDVTIATGKPLRLYSNLAKTPVPLVVDFKAQRPPGTVQGDIAVQRSVIAIFRREATLEYLRLTQQPGAPAMDLDGLIRYEVDEAAIGIHLLGDTRKPRVEFDSDPPMERHEIIALLLFGKSPGELDSDQDATVGNTQAALSSSAFGLASLYLFASTPVEYVGYDPASRSYTMKFRLPGGASLEIRSDLEAGRHLTLRKRLAPHWELQTELTNSAPAQGQGGAAAQTALTTFLQWFNHY